MRGCPGQPWEAWCVLTLRDYIWWHDDEPGTLHSDCGFSIVQATRKAVERIHGMFSEEAAGGDKCLKTVLHIGAIPPATVRKAGNRIPTVMSKDGKEHRELIKEIMDRARFITEPVVVHCWEGCRCNAPAKRYRREGRKD